MNMPIRRPVHREHVVIELEAANVPHTFITIEGADHIFMRHAWAQDVIRHTTGWLRRHLI